MRDETDIQAFYEGKFIQPKDFRFRSGGIFGKIFRAVAMDYSRRRARFLERHIEGKDNEILDIGCGAGTKLLTEYGRVTGIDLSQSSLQIAAQMYSNVKLGDGSELPSENECFDYVIGIDVFGHILVEQKDIVLREIRRVLKPGGKVIFSAVETESKDWLSRLVRREPGLYHEIFVMKHGHFGYEFPSEVIRRVQANGFILNDTRKIQGGLFIEPYCYMEWFRGTGYAKRFPFLGLLGNLVRLLFAADDRIFGKRQFLLGTVRFILGLIDTVFAEHILSIDHTRALAICAQKPSGITHP